MTVDQREKATLNTIANSIEAQADCLDKYAESNGFEAKPVPSVFHIQSSHFRDQANKIRELIGVE